MVEQPAVRHRNAGAVSLHRAHQPLEEDQHLPQGQRKETTSHVKQVLQGAMAALSELTVDYQTK